MTGTRGLRGATVKVFGIGRGWSGKCRRGERVVGKYCEPLSRDGANFRHGESSIGETRLRRWVIAVVAGTRLVREFLDSIEGRRWSAHSARAFDVVASAGSWLQ